MTQIGPITFDHATGALVANCKVTPNMAAMLAQVLNSWANKKKHEARQRGASQSAIVRRRKGDPLPRKHSS